MTRLLYLAWVYTMIGLWTLVVFPSSFIVTLLTGSHRIGHRIHAAFWGRMILRTCCVRLRVHGLEWLQPAKSYVLMLNHNSHFAGYAVAAGIPLQWRAVLALKLRKIPLFAWIGHGTRTSSGWRWTRKRRHILLLRICTQPTS